MTTQRSTLVHKLHALAATGHARAADLSRCALELQDAIDRFDGGDAAVPVHELVACWSRARLLWQECVGIFPLHSDAGIAA